MTPSNILAVIHGTVQKYQYMNSSTFTVCLIAQVSVRLLWSRLMYVCFNYCSGYFYVSTWLSQCPDIWWNIILDISMKMLLTEINTEIGGL